MITTKLERTTDRVTKLIISYNGRSDVITTDRISANNGQKSQANYFLQQTEYYDYNRPNKSKQRTDKLSQLFLTTTEYCMITTNGIRE